MIVWFNPSVLWPPPLYFAAQNTGEEGEMYSPFASASILYTTPRKAAGHGRGGVLKYPFDSGTWILILRVDFPIFFQNIGGREILFLSWSSIFYVVSGNYSTFSPVSRSGIGERPKERSSGGEGLKGRLFIHSSQQREERTQKRRRSYRAYGLVATVSPSGAAELTPLGQSSPFFLRLPCVFAAR